MSNRTGKPPIDQAGWKRKVWKCIVYIPVALGVVGLGLVKIVKK